MEREIYQKQYDFELEQKNHFASAANLPIVALTVISGALSTMIVGYKYTVSLPSFLFVIFSAVVFLSILYSIYCVFRSFLDYEYQKIPSAKKLSLHMKDLIAWHKQKIEDEAIAKIAAKADFDEYIDDKLSTAAENNSLNNRNRGDFIHSSTASIAVSFILLLLVGSLYTYQRVTQEENVQKIEIVKSTQLNTRNISVAKKNNNSSDSNNAKNTESNNTQTQNPPVTKPITVKPAGPQNETFKSNLKIDKIKDNNGG